MQSSSKPRNGWQEFHRQDGSKLLILWSDDRMVECMEVHRGWIKVEPITMTYSRIVSRVYDDHRKYLAEGGTIDNISGIRLAQTATNLCLPYGEVKDAWDFHVNEVTRQPPPAA